MKILFGNYNDKKIHGISQISKFCGFNSVVWNTNKNFIETASFFKPDIFICNNNFFVDMNNKYENSLVKYFNNHPECIVIINNQSKLEKEISIIHTLVDINYGANLFNGHYGKNTKSFVLCGNFNKNENIEKFLGKFVDKNNQVPIKIFSDENWPGEYYCGPITDQDFSRIANLSIFSLQLEESQSLYDAILNKSLVLTNDQNIPIVPIVSSYEDIIDRINHFNKNPREYDSLIDMSYKYVIQNCTYFHEFQNMLKACNLNFPILEKLKELL